MTVLRSDFIAVNSRGVTVYSFSDEKKARAWVRENACRHDGLHLRAVQITARTIYRPRSYQQPVSFAIPAYREVRA